MTCPHHLVRDISEVFKVFFIDLIEVRIYGGFRQDIGDTILNAASDAVLNRYFLGICRQICCTDINVNISQHEVRNIPPELRKYQSKQSLGREIHPRLISEILNFYSFTDCDLTF